MRVRPHLYNRSTLRRATTRRKLNRYLQLIDLSVMSVQTHRGNSFAIRVMSSLSGRSREGRLNVRPQTFSTGVGPERHDISLCDANDCVKRRRTGRAVEDSEGKPK